MRNISILIPAYNYECTALVRTLQRQAASLPGNYEILVADDGSTNTNVIARNRAINQLPHCRLLECSPNKGRACVRNYLARQAQYEWLLFLDCDMEVSDADFLQHYDETTGYDVVDGGIRIGGDSLLLQGNIRYLYEHHVERHHTAAERSKHPYRSFRTTNFMVARHVMQEHPFNEQFRYYGYEDVLFGKELQQSNTSIVHIDNPTMLTDYETNPVFISKTEEGLRTLYQFRTEIGDYSHLLVLSEKIPRRVVRLWHRLFGRWERKILVGKHPSLAVFNLYKLGYFVSLF